MDEPSSGVDPENRRQIWTLIESLKDPETAIILTTHHLEEAEYLSEDVAILSKGKVVI
jgi:ATP-binding cassette, subfamily A (ABC1), member 3